MPRLEAVFIKNCVNRDYWAVLQAAGSGETQKSGPYFDSCQGNGYHGLKVFLLKIIPSDGNYCRSSEIAESMILTKSRAVRTYTDCMPDMLLKAVSSSRPANCRNVLHLFWRSY
jgi:hypothetical protein